ncbi:hypothetical protein ACLOJK_007671 [Asimina triloba]
MARGRKVELEQKGTGKGMMENGAQVLGSKTMKKVMNMRKSVEVGARKGREQKPKDRASVGSALKFV